MVAVNTGGSTAYRRQFTMTSSKTTISFASMFAAGSGGSSAPKDFANIFSDSGNDTMLSRLYEQMTGQTIGSRTGGINAGRTFNVDSKGDHELTAGEIEMLRAKYDVNNLTSRERYDLLCDLTDMGVLTADEAASAGRMAIVKTETFSFSLTITYIQTDGDEKDTLLAHLMAMLKKERESLASALGLIGGDGCRLTAAKLEASITRHEKVATVIEKLDTAPSA